MKSAISSVQLCRIAQPVGLYYAVMSTYCAKMKLHFTELRE